MSLPLWADALVAMLLALGGVFTLVGSLGLTRLSDFYRRLHGPTKATTLGVGCLLLASMLFFTLAGGRLSVHELLIALFLLLTAPVSAQMLIKAALRLNPESRPAPPETKDSAR